VRNLPDIIPLLGTNNEFKAKQENERVKVMLRGEKSASRQ